MKTGHILLVSGLALTVGAIAAIAASPREPRDGVWDTPEMGMPRMDMMGTMQGPRRGGMREWFASRSITADEYDARTRERFARLDKNGDAVLDASEIESAILDRSRRGPEKRRGATGESLLGALGDKDGKITKDAFLSEAKRRFAQFDLNSDGKITDDDLPPAMRGRNALKSGASDVLGHRGHGLERLRAADTKGDGVILLDAFLAVESKRFEDLDRNKDGVIDKSDFEALRKETVAYGVKRFVHAYGADADGKVTREQFYKVAKERFARLDLKGEGRITFDGQGDRGGMARRSLMSGPRDRGQMGPDRGLPSPPSPKQ